MRFNIISLFIENYICDFEAFKKTDKKKKS